MVEADSPKPTESFCLCSDPEFCLRSHTSARRVRAIAYRREHGAPLPMDAQQWTTREALQDALTLLDATDV